MTEPSPTRRFTLAVDPAEPPRALQGGVFAIGNFDGLHRGHKAVLLRTKAIAAALGVPAAVLTFEPHPSDYFRGAGTIFRLTPLAAKAHLVERLGMDGMVVLKFDDALADLGAELFVSQILIDLLRVGAVVVGYDFHFGRMRQGTPAFLEAAGAAHGFGVTVIPKIGLSVDGVEGTASSSTLTRQALEAGDVGRAAALLGHAYTIGGTVLPGQRLGRTLGFPTANIEADRSCRLRHGIYAVRVRIDGAVLPGVASWGRRPTVDNGAPLLEVHLFDFAGDLYGKEMEVVFVAWLRAEERFASLAALTAQMVRDLVDARDALAAAPALPDL